MPSNNELAVLYVKIQAKTDQLEKELNKIKSKSDSAVGSMASGFSKVAGTLGLVTSAGAIVDGTISLLTNSVKAFVDQAKSIAKVEQAIKITGGVAGYTSDELQNMAEKLSDISGIDDTDILNDITAQLLTFTHIAGPAFDRAQQAALDLSAVLGNDLKGQTIQLGKALEDPIRGVAALSKAGVTFTETQKENIKQLISQNNLYEAQSIILTEIEAKYGGQAEAVNKVDGGMANLAVSIDSISEGLGKKLLPFIETVIGGFEIFLEQMGLISDNKLDLGTKDLINELIKTGATLEQINEARRTYIKELKLDLQNNTDEYSSQGANLNSQVKVQKQITFIQGEILKNQQEYVDALADVGAASGEDRKNKEVILNKAKANLEAAKDELNRLNSMNDAYNGIKKIQQDINSGKREGLVITSSVVKLTEDEQKYVDGISNSINNQREKIKLLKYELSKTTGSGKESAEKKVILTANIKDLQEKLNADEIKIGLRAPEVPSLSEMVNEDIKNTDTDAFDLEVAEADISKYNKIKETHQDFLNTMSAANDTAYQKRKEILDQELEDRIAAAEGEYDANAIIEEAKAIHDEKMIRLEKERADGMQEIREAELEGAKEVADAMSTIEQGLAAVFGEQSAVYKIAAGVQAVIATYLAASKALAEVPFPLNFVAAASVTAAGLANVAKIASAHYGGTFVNGQKVAGYAMGGDFIVPPGYPQDSYPIMVESGERVTVTPRTAVQSQNISLNDERIVSALAAVNRNLINLDRRVTSVEIDGKSLAKVIVKNINEFNQAGYDTSQII